MVITSLIKRMIRGDVPLAGTLSSHLEFIRRIRFITQHVFVACKGASHANIAGYLGAYPVFAPVFTGFDRNAGGGRRLCSCYAGSHCSGSGRVFEVRRSEDSTLSSVPQGLG